MISRRTLLGVTPLLMGADSTGSPQVEPPLFDVEERSLSDLRAALDGKRVTSVQLVEAYLARIAKLDANGPMLKSVLELNPDAKRIAAECDAATDKKPRGPLHGIPVLLKDNIDTADQQHTTAGSLALLDAPAPKEDAGLVKQLRAAGAVVLGKTNLSEWANLRGRASTSGWSARGGLTRNPYVTTRNASGSSSGSAVAVAASLCAASIGTETDGSIVSPASICGIVGFKPTVGLVSRSGIIPLSHTQDTAGPMTRSVKDAALLLDAICGVDARDDATSKRPKTLAPNFTRALEGATLKGKRLGVVRRLVEAGWTTAPVAREVVKSLTTAGATVVDVELGARSYEDAEMEVLLFELKNDFDAYLSARGGPMKSLADVVQFNLAHASDELSFFGQQHFDDAVRRGPYSSSEYVAALSKCSAARESIVALMKDQKLDAIVAPTGAPAWLSDLVNGDAFGFSFSTPAAVAGCPHVSVPMGFVGELPVSLSFIAAPWEDAKVLALGHAFELATHARKPPRYFTR
ncbi:MAG: amidase [Archangium sp.]|nr:amidase [Archangium sp.]